MFHTIRTRPAAPPTDEPTELLLACHGRLRQFSVLSHALASRNDLDDALVVDAAQRLLRYFRLALPLHEEDEEQSLVPLLALRATPEQVDAMERMREEHRVVHELLAELFPHWDRATSEPRALDRGATLPHALRLATVLDAHLGLEERVVFPMVAALTQPERKRLVDEMRARRDQPPHSVAHSDVQAVLHKHE